MRDSKRAWRGALSVAAALFFAWMPSIGHAATQTTLCVTPQGRIVGFTAPCPAPQTGLTFDTSGIVGPTGPQGATGAAGPNGSTGPAGPAGSQGLPGVGGNNGIAGPTGPTGQTGPQGVHGPDGDIGPNGPTGEAGHVGHEGKTGATGPTGDQGVTGLTGATGPTGPKGIDAFNASVLTGGNLGQDIGGSSGGTQLLPSITDPPDRFIFLGPGNGANPTQESEDVPMPPGTLRNLQVHIDNDPGPPHAFVTVDVCVNDNCNLGLSCTITHLNPLAFVDTPPSVSCSDTNPAHALTINDGDLLSLRAVADTDVVGPRNLSWSLVFQTSDDDDGNAD